MLPGSKRYIVSADLGVEPKSDESESPVLPLHQSAIADAEGLEPSLMDLEAIVLIHYTKHP